MPPIISIWNSDDTELLDDVSFLGVVPGVESDPVILRIWNNKGESSGDSLTSGVLTIWARKPTISDPSPAWLRSGIQLLDSKLVRAVITGYEGNAELSSVGKIRIGAGASFPLPLIPYDSAIEISLTLLSSSTDSVQGVDIKVGVEDLSSIALADGIFESAGNGIYLGIGNPSFSQLFRESAAPTANGTNPYAAYGDESFIYRGIPYSVEGGNTPSLASDLDGDAAALASGEAFYALYVLRENALVEIKGSKNTAPLINADLPDYNDYDIPLFAISKRYGENVEQSDISTFAALGFGSIAGVSSLSGYISKLTCISNRAVVYNSAASLFSVDDDSVSIAYLDELGNVIIGLASDYASDNFLEMYEITSSSGSIVEASLADKRRYLGEESESLYFVGGEIAEGATKFFINSTNKPIYLLPYGGIVLSISDSASSLVATSGNWEVSVKRYNGGTWTDMCSSVSIPHDSTEVVSRDSLVTDCVILPGEMVKVSIEELAVATYDPTCIAVAMRTFK